MSSLFKMPSMPAPPALEMPKVEDVPSAEDAAREAQEAEDMRRRQRNRKGRRSTILTTPDYEDTAATTRILYAFAMSKAAKPTPPEHPRIRTSSSSFNLPLCINA